jgi:hypothetical protein
VYEAGGVGSDVPTGLPRPLRVGQAVVARHPAVRAAADGIVLTIKPTKYRVQFNRCALRARARVRVCVGGGACVGAAACTHGGCQPGSMLLHANTQVCVACTPPPSPPPSPRAPPHTRVCLQHLTLDKHTHTHTGRSS